ncbi:MAG TPA: TAXI family TRAP transporter solute-binding subunit [Desulfatiglandales bacterium]|nr:TAXI family TRAP transporter solute-binding subunit [Desulfatiglandales bacterium]
MNKALLCSLAGAVAIAFSFVHVEACSAKTTIVTIGTGGITSVYYPTGGAISMIVNKKSKQYYLRATVESTGGSVFNVNAVMAGDMEFGVVRSDQQYQAWNGIQDWEDKGPQKKLRAICSFFPETIVLVASDDSGIREFMDLRGKHVSIGNTGSGHRGHATDALRACGIDRERDLQAEGLKADESAKFLQDGRIDAFFDTVTHPDASTKEATSGKRKVYFVPITGDCIDKLVAKWPFYAKAYIPIKFYPTARNKEDVPTFAVKATFVTSADIPDDIVYAITKEVFDNLEDFKNLNPAYGVLTKENMLEALTAPIHPGAMRYYKEVGLK